MTYSRSLATILRNFAAGFRRETEHACGLNLSIDKNQMINDDFDHIVGIGGHCQTAYQIRRYFGVDKAYPFDWWVTPTVGLVDLIESEFADLFKEENMKIVHEKTGPAVMCSRYHLMHYHDFDEAKIAGQYSPYLVRTQCAKNNSKFAYLVSRLLNLSGKVLFVRFSHGWAEFDDRVCMFNEDLLQRLVNALNKILPNAEVHLLLLNDYNNQAGLDGNPMPGVYTSVLNNYDSTEWYGSDKGWDELFEYHKIRLRSPGQEAITGQAIDQADDLAADRVIAPSEIA